MKPDDSGGNVHLLDTTCARCGARVALLYFEGESTLVEPRLDADAAGNLVVARHVCSPESDRLNRNHPQPQPKVKKSPWGPGRRGY